MIEMINQINNAFADLDKKMHNSAVDFVTGRKENWAKLYDAKHKELLEQVKTGEIKRITHSNIMNNWVRNYFGSDKMHSLIRWNKIEVILEKIEKETQAKIDRRNAQIIDALSRKEVTEIPEFTLVEYSNGLEGFFDVAGHKVHIRTILAGGYNIQCLHTRTLININ